ncbi:MAG: nucleotide exchange factor GrpE [Pontimonas sp.]|nr:nucleotide exchange factor GrpE [Pontimonas sp.]
MVRIPEAGAQGETVAEVIEGGYTLGERLIRAAKVAVKVPADE